MKLEDKKREIVKSEGLTEHTLKIGEDPRSKRIVIDLLSSKLYKNKLLSALREILSNAIDANIEADRKDKQIDIKLPTEEDPYVSIRDYGYGMSKEKMINVYIYLGLSTKREDNKQHGAFGIGSISPFSVTEQFEVTTIHKGIKYAWLVYKNEEEIPVITLLNEEETKEHDGTKVSFYIDRAYQEQCIDYVEALTMFSELRYNIVNKKEPKTEPYYEYKEKLDEGYFYSCKQQIKKNYTSKCFIVVVVGDIPYTLDCFNQFTELYNNNNPVLRRTALSPYNVSLFNHCSDLKSFILFKKLAEDFKVIAIKAEIGELDLTSSREDLVFNDKLKNFVTDKLRNILERYTLKLEAEVEKETDLIKKLEIGFNKFPLLLSFKHKGKDYNYRDNFINLHRLSFSNCNFCCRAYFPEESLTKTSVKYFNFVPSEKDTNYIDLTVGGFIPLILFLKYPVVVMSSRYNLNKVVSKLKLETTTIFIRTNKHEETIEELKELKEDGKVLQYPNDFVTKDKTKKESIKSIDLENLKETNKVYVLKKQQEIPENNKYGSFLETIETEYSLPKEGGVYCEKRAVNLDLDNNAYLSNRLISSGLIPRVYFVNSTISNRLKKLSNWLSVDQYAEYYLKECFKDKEDIKNVILIMTTISEYKLDSIKVLCKYINDRRPDILNQKYLDFINSPSFETLRLFKDDSFVYTKTDWSKAERGKFEYVFKELLGDYFIYFISTVQLLYLSGIDLDKKHCVYNAFLVLKFLEGQANQSNQDEFENISKLLE